MEILIGVFILSIIILLIGFDIKLKKIKELKEINFDEENIKLVEKLPSNIEICKEILEKFKNENVKIECDENSNSSYYIVLSNKIIIGNVNKSFTRIQTVIHECIHSVQNRKILLANYILSNLNNLYFLALIILGIINKTSEYTNYILLAIFVSLQFIAFSIRSFLELDAMIRAEYETDKYLENKTQNKDEIMLKYKELNKIGIKLYICSLLLKALAKIFIINILAKYS